MAARRHSSRLCGKWRSSHYSSAALTLRFQVVAAYTPAATFAQAAPCLDAHGLDLLQVARARAQASASERRYSLKCARSSECLCAILPLAPAVKSCFSIAILQKSSWRLGAQPLPALAFRRGGDYGRMRVELSTSCCKVGRQQGLLSSKTAQKTFSTMPIRLLNCYSRHCRYKATLSLIRLAHRSRSVFGLHKRYFELSTARYETMTQSDARSKRRPAVCEHCGGCVFFVVSMRRRAGGAK